MTFQKIISLFYLLKCLKGAYCNILLSLNLMIFFHKTKTYLICKYSAINCDSKPKTISQPVSKNNWQGIGEGLFGLFIFYPFEALVVVIVIFYFIAQ